MKFPKGKQTSSGLAPGTVILDDSVAFSENRNSASHLKHGTGKNKNIVLIPQPSDDPNDPLNFPFSKKMVILSVTGFGISIFASTVGPLLNASFVPISVELDTTVAKLVNATGYQTITVAAWSLVVNAAARKWGKRPVFLASGIFNLVGSSIGATSTTYEQLLAGRIIQGFSVSAYESLVFAMTSDLFFLHERGLYVSVVSFLLAVVSNFSSVICGPITTHLGWKWLFYFLILFGGIQTILQFLFVPETQYTRYQSSTSDIGTGSKEAEIVDSEISKPYTTEIENRVANDTEVPKLKTFVQNLAVFTGTHSEENFGRLLLGPIAVCLNVAVLWSLLTSAFFFSLYITIANLLAQVFSAPSYLLDASGIGYLSLGPFLGGLLGAAIAGLLNDRLVRRCARKNGGIYEPEYRLLMMAFGTLAFPGIVGFGYVAEEHKSYYLAAVLHGLGLFGVVFVLIATSSYILDAYPQMGNEMFLASMASKNIMIYGYSYFINDWATRDGPAKELWVFSVVGDASCVLYSCHFCADSFTRDDNLQRHLLSHATPQFQCEHCGMQFHRTDVLKRHRLVHQPNPHAKRRKPRRGPLPDSFIQRRSATEAPPPELLQPTSTPISSSSVMADASPVDTSEPPLSPNTEITFYERELPLSVEQRSTVSPITNEDAPSEFEPTIQNDLEAFDFCLSHFRHSCNYRSPFIHHTTTSDPFLSERMKLAIAAVAGAGFQKYTQQCRGFFEKARRGTKLFDCETSLITDDPSEDLSRPLLWLRDLQFRVLLLEYAMWSGESTLESWAAQGTSSILKTIREVFANKKLHPFGSASTSWKSWTCDEELRRYIFLYYGWQPISPII
ncbi:major facilitator superfamily transporter [Fusarium oxysporum f. sp. phaseoli]